MKTGMTRTALWLRIVCAVLLLCLGFAHKPLYAQPSSDPASSYYLLPDGTFASLCIDNADHGKPGKSWLGSGCEACRLSSSVLLPTPGDDGHAPVSRDCNVVEFPAGVAYRATAAWRPGSPVRGPPSILA